MEPSAGAPAEAALQVSAQVLCHKERLCHSFGGVNLANLRSFPGLMTFSSILLRVLPKWRILILPPSSFPASQLLPVQAAAARAQSHIQKPPEGLQPLPGYKQGKAGQPSGLLPPELCSAFILMDVTNRKSREPRGLEEEITV